MSDTRQDIIRDRIMMEQEELRFANQDYCEHCPEHNPNCPFYDAEEEFYDYNTCYDGWEM